MNTRRGRIGLVLGAMALTLSLALLPLGCGNEPEPARGASIVISGDTGAWIVPCGCASNQAGGLPRRGAYLAELRQTEDVLYLDAGGAAAGTTQYYREKFLAVLAGESAMGIAVHNVGSAELELGIDALRAAAASHRINFVSANVRLKSGEPAFNASHIATVGGQRVAIVGVVSKSFVKGDVNITDPRDAVLATLAQIKGQYDRVLVLAYVPDAELNALASALPEADAVIGGPTGQAVAPHRVGPSLVGSATNKGKYVVRLSLPADGKSTWRGESIELGARFADDPKQTQLLQQYLARLAQLDLPADQTGIVATTPHADPGYRVAGSDSCVSCHQPDDAVWHASRHSHAGATLQAKGFHVDAQCLQCHTTGFALPGGFASPGRTPGLMGVGCESCHGPSLAHVKQPTVRTPYNAMDQCIRCHDQENSPHFDQPSYWAKVRHGPMQRTPATRPSAPKETSP